jgi:hypothetical protein
MQTPTVQYQVQKSLLFDYGLPAAGWTTRLYNVGFAGLSTQVGQAV